MEENFSKQSEMLRTNILLLESIFKWEYLLRSIEKKTWPNIMKISRSVYHDPNRGCCMLSELNLRSTILNSWYIFLRHWHFVCLTFHGLVASSAYTSNKYTSDGFYSGWQPFINPSNSKSCPWNRSARKLGDNSRTFGLRIYDLGKWWFENADIFRRMVTSNGPPVYFQDNVVKIMRFQTVCDEKPLQYKWM